MRVKAEKEWQVTNPYWFPSSGMKHKCGLDPDRDCSLNTHYTVMSLKQSVYGYISSESVRCVLFSEKSKAE